MAEKTVCDICDRLGAETYTIGGWDEGTLEIDLCEEHVEPLDALREHGRWNSTQKRQRFKKVDASRLRRPKREEASP